MPRQSRGSSGGARAPSRPTVAPARPNVAPPHSQTRPASTAVAHPPAAAGPPQQHAPAQQGPGLFGQMASTAAGVAVGSSIGHAIGGFFGGGGSSAAPAEQQQTQPQQYAAETAEAQYQYGPKACDIDARNFTKCMDENSGNMQICSWYLEQLKACQQASSQY